MSSGMRRLLAVTILVVHAPLARAQAPAPRVQFTLDGGMGIPLGPEVFDDLWGPGVGAGLGVEYLSNVVGMWGRFSYTRFALDERRANGAFYTQGPPAGVSGGELSMWRAQVGLRLRPQSGVLRPYLDAGVGVGTIGASDIEVRYVDFLSGELRSYPVRFASETKPSLAAGVGLSYSPSPSLAVFAGAYLDVLLTEGETTTFVPIRLGVVFR
jgi:opacity protein-like surface antigen